MPATQLTQSINWGLLQWQVNWKNVSIKGKKGQDKIRMHHGSFCHGRWHHFFCTFSPARESPLLPFHVQNVGRVGLPYDRSVLHRDKNTWTCFTVSILIPGRKGYFCFNSEGLLKEGTLQFSLAVRMWHILKTRTYWEVPQKPFRGLRRQREV